MIYVFLKKIKNKKGASSIEFAYAMLLFLTLLIAGFEFFMIGYKYMTVSNFANEIASTIAIQGGVRPSKPTGYSSGGTSYKTTVNMVTSMGDLGKKIGQTPNDISIKIKYQPEGSNSFTTTTLSGASNVEIPYGNRFEVTVSYVFRLHILNKIIPLQSSTVIQKTKGDVAQFEYDY